MNNGRTEWTVADAAVLFKEPVEDLVSDFAIEAISGGSEYQLNQNGSVDISLFVCIIRNNQWRLRISTGT